MGEKVRGNLIIIGGAEDKYGESKILKPDISVSFNIGVLLCEKLIYALHNSDSNIKSTNLVLKPLCSFTRYAV